MGNGAKSAQRRERSGKEEKVAKSQLRVNAAAKNIICKNCRQAFLLTTRKPALEEHAANKHNKSYDDCFGAT